MLEERYAEMKDRVHARAPTHGARFAMVASLDGQFLWVQRARVSKLEEWCSRLAGVPRRWPAGHAGS